jgi:hypothetical protein
MSQEVFRAIKIDRCLTDVCSLWSTKNNEITRIEDKCSQELFLQLYDTNKPLDFL